jgi:hypothetical protein
MTGSAYKVIEVDTMAGWERYQPRERISAP